MTIKYWISVFGVLCERYCVFAQYAEPGNHLAYWIVIYFCCFYGCECVCVYVCVFARLNILDKMLIHCQ